jgi:hypothetical protein
MGAPVASSTQMPVRLTLSPGGGQRELPEFLSITAGHFNELSCATAQEKKNQKDGDWDPYKP